MVVIAPANHRLASRKSIALSEIASEHFILCEQGSGARIALETLFARAGYKIKVRMELGSNEAVKQAILGGLGISLLSQHTLISGDLNDLAILNVEGFPVSWQWYVGHHRKKHLSVVAGTFIDFMYQHGPSLLRENIKLQALDWGCHISLLIM